MATRIVGWDAIRFAERQGCRLARRADGVEEARDDLTVEEARSLAGRAPELIYVDVDEPPPGADRLA